MTVRRAVLWPRRVYRFGRETRRLLANSPVPDGWTRSAAATQMRLVAGVVRREDGIVHVRVGDWDVAGFSTKSLGYLHSEIFVKLAYYFRATRADPFIVDGGSNIGMSVLFFKALYPEARVLAFEPAEPAHRLLARNVEANRLSGVEIHRAALGRYDGETAFYDEPHDPATFRMSTRRERLPDPRETTVAQRRLSDFVDGAVDLVKLDIEGAEDDVLADLVDSRAIEQVQQLILEYHHHLDPARDFVDDFLRRLREEGFRYQLGAGLQPSQRAALAPVFQDVVIHAYRPESVG